MAKHRDAPDIIEEVESAAERLAGWIGAHAWHVGGGMAVLLALAFGVQTCGDLRRAEQEAASNALDQVKTSYMLALGADPASIDTPELANPKAAQAIQRDFLDRFRKVASDHPGTVSGTLALFEVAAIQEALGEPGQSVSVWQEALDSAQDRPELLAVLQQRIAQVHEKAGAYEKAAEAYEAAGSIAEFPLRWWALANAARCRVEAGDRVRALELYEQIEAGAPDFELPDYLRAQFRELRASQAG